MRDREHGSSSREDGIRRGRPGPRCVGLADVETVARWWLELFSSRKAWIFHGDDRAALGFVRDDGTRREKGMGGFSEAWIRVPVDASHLQIRQERFCNNARFSKATLSIALCL